MKTAGSNTLANLASSQFVKAELWDLTLAGGTVLRFTDFDHPLTLGANVYASNMVITRGSINQRIGLDPQTLDVQMSPQADAPSPATIGGASFLRATKLGALSGARMMMRKIFAAKPIDGSATVKTNGESVLWYAGIVDDVEVGQMTANLVLNPDVSLLNVQMPRNVIQPGCLHSLFDAGCGLSQASFQVSGTITSGATSTAFGATGFGSQASNYFALGRVQFLTGALAGITRTVKTYLNSGGAFTVFDPLPTAPATGDTFLAIAGCDKQQATCSSKFSNLSRFRGYPYVPVPETLYDGGSIAIPAPTVGGQGTPGTGSLWPSNLPNGYTA